MLSYFYWSGSVDGQNNVWFFRTSNGGQFSNSKTNSYYAIAVQSGDVIVVPEPIGSILFITGGTLLVVRLCLRRKK